MQYTALSAVALENSTPGPSVRIFCRTYYLPLQIRLQLFVRKIYSKFTFEIIIQELYILLYYIYYIYIIIYTYDW